MAINAILPPIVEVVPILTAWFFQRRDQSWNKDKLESIYTTKTTQIY